MARQRPRVALLSGPHMQVRREADPAPDPRDQANRYGGNPADEFGILGYNKNGAAGGAAEGALVGVSLDARTRATARGGGSTAS